LARTLLYTEPLLVGQGATDNPKTKAKKTKTKTHQNKTMATLTKTKNKPVQLVKLLERMGMENFGKHIRGNGEIFILRSLENLPEWKPINIGITQKTNRLKGRILETGKIFNVDDSPYWAILNVMFKHNLKYMADLVYKAELKKTKTGKTFRDISWEFEDNSKIAVEWAKNKLAEEKAINKLANDTWQEWTVEERIRAELIKTAPQRAEKEKIKREKRNKNKQEKLDNELFAALV